MLIYVSGPYTLGDIDTNIAKAREVAVELWKMGYAVICPHTNTAHFDCPEIPYEAFIAGDVEMVRRVDALVMLPGWMESKGAVREHQVAEDAGIPCYVWPGVPPLPVTEQRCPEQSAAFLDTVMKMYRVHLAKNADYSPANILATGEIGLVTRLWDKIARLMNLEGFRFKVEFEKLEPPKTPKHESIDDTLMDAAVYSVIGLLLRRNVWGK